MKNINSQVMASSTSKASKYFIKQLKAVNGKDNTTGECYFQYGDYRFCMEGSFSSWDFANGGKHLHIIWSIEKKSGLRAAMCTKDTRRFSEVVYTYKSSFKWSEADYSLDVEVAMESYVEQFVQFLFSYDDETGEFGYIRPADLVVNIDLSEVSEADSADSETPEADYAAMVEKKCDAMGAEMHSDSGVVNGYNVWYKDCLVWSGVLDNKEITGEAMEAVEAFVAQYEAEMADAQIKASEVAFKMGYDLAYADNDAELLGEDVDLEAMLDEDGDLRIPLFQEGDIEYIAENMAFEVLPDSVVMDIAEKFGEGAFYDGYTKAISDLGPEDWKNLEWGTNGYVTWISFDRVVVESNDDVNKAKMAC